MYRNNQCTISTLELSLESIGQTLGNAIIHTILIYSFRIVFLFLIMY